MNNKKYSNRLLEKNNNKEEILDCTKEIEEYIKELMSKEDVKN